MKGWTVDGREVELTQSQADSVKLLLTDYGVPVFFGGRRSGRSTVIYTARKYDVEYRQRGLPLPWPEVDEHEAHTLAARVHAAIYQVNSNIGYHEQLEHR